MELSQPFVRLPFTFDAKRLSEELDQFNTADWMEHPNKMEGNLAIPLVSLDGKDNNEFSGCMLPTAHLENCEYALQVMASFNEVISRSRFMRLNAGCQVTEHVDFNYHWYNRVRVHIPIITEPDVIFHCGDQSIHMRAGESWIFDSWRRHKVINHSRVDRVHLVLDTAGSSRFWKTVRQMQALGASSISQNPNAEQTNIPYREGFVPKLKTERFNSAPVMAPGEMEAIAKELIQDVRSNPDNNQTVVDSYEELLIDLSKDWREAWSLYGYTEEGTHFYKKLLHRTAKQLSPNPRILVTLSNDVGINPIIMQRILRAALS